MVITTCSGGGWTADCEVDDDGKGDDALVTAFFTDRSPERATLGVLDTATGPVVLDTAVVAVSFDSS